MKHIVYCCISSGFVVWNQTEEKCLNSILADKIACIGGGGLQIGILTCIVAGVVMGTTRQCGQVTPSRISARCHHHQSKISIKMTHSFMADILSSSPCQTSTMVEDAVGNINHRRSGHMLSQSACSAPVDAWQRGLLGEYVEINHKLRKVFVKPKIYLRELTFIP